MVVIAVGASEIVGQIGTGLDGIRLARVGEVVNATIIDKDVERPGPFRGIRGESVSINDVQLRSLRTYFNQYILIVSNAGTERAAPVSYDAFQAARVGTSVQVSVADNVPGFADMSRHATLFYALRQMALGLLIVGVGVLALRLPDSD